MSFFSDLGKTLGGIAGTAFGGPLGSMAGSALGGVAGNALESLFGGGGRPSLEGLLGGSGLPLPFGAGQVVNLVDRNLGKVVDALGDNVAGGIRGAGDIRDALFGNVAGGIENVGQVRDAIFDRMEGAIRNFGPGALPWLGRPAMPWPFPNLPIPRLPFCPVGPGAVQAPPSQPGQASLETNGKDTVDTGRYLVTCKEGEVKVYDKETNTWVKCHGDPHLLTSDGDKGQFHENMTLQLEDGTKITIKTTPKDANGVAYIDSVAVMKGDQAVVIDGFHDGKSGVEMGNILNNRNFVDAAWKDGTVMVAGHQVDDLTFAANGRELVGTDPNARWGEHNLDGFGGAPKNPPVEGGNGGTGGAGGTNGTGGGNGAGGATGADGANGAGNDFGFAPGDSLIDKLFKILSKLEEKLNGAVEKLGSIKEGDQSGLQKAMFEIQKLQNQMKQVFETATNIQKSNDDTKEAIIRNFA